MYRDSAPEYHVSVILEGKILFAFQGGCRYHGEKMREGPLLE